MTRDSANIRFFIDGTQLGSTNTSIGSTSIPAVTAGVGEDDTGFSLGAYDLRSGGASVAGSELNGWIDEVRLTIGTARYTANFDAPEEAFPDS